MSTNPDPDTLASRFDQLSSLREVHETISARIGELEEPFHQRIRALLCHEGHYNHSKDFRVEGELFHFTAVFTWENDEEYPRAIPIRFITEPDVSLVVPEYRAWIKEQDRIAADLAMQKAGAEREAKERTEYECLRARFESKEEKRT